MGAVTKGANFVLRVVGSHFGVFNVRWYGAACDATAAGAGTDDTTAVQAAITAAQAVNGTVFIPARCKVTSTLTATASVTICGPGGAPDSGSGAIGYAPRGQLISTSTSGDVIAVTGNSSSIGAHIHDLAIVGVTTYTSHTAGAGIRLTNCIGSTIERVTVFNKYDGIVSDGAGTSWFTKIRDCEVALIKHHGVSAEMSAFGHGFYHINGCQITNGNGTKGTGAGINLTNCTPYVSNCEAIGFATGVSLYGRTEYGYFSEVLADTCTLGWNLNGTQVLDYTDTMPTNTTSVNPFLLMCGVNAAGTPGSASALYVDYMLSASTKMR